MVGTLLNTRLVGNVAADEFAAQLIGGAHDDEAASCRVYDKVSWVRTAPISRLMSSIGLMCGCSVRLTFSGHRFEMP